MLKPDAPDSVVKPKCLKVVYLKRFVSLISQIKMTEAKQAADLFQTINFHLQV